MKQNNIILSIIVPVYNVEKYIKQCLESIVSQNVDKDYYEVIVVNDGTQDTSMDIVYNYTSKCNMRVLNQINQGLSVARNNGLSASSGRYVWFVDSDDWLLPNSIQTVLNEIDNSNSDVISSPLLCCREKDSYQYVEFVPKDKILSGKGYLWKGYSKGASQRFIIKKQFLDINKVTFYPGILHEDGLFGNQMLYLAESVTILQKPVYAYRIRYNGSIMSSIKIKSAYDLLFIHKELLHFMNQKVHCNDYVKYKICINTVLYSLLLFCIGIKDTEEFKMFYKANLSYIRSQSIVLWKSPKYWLKAVVMCSYPIHLIMFRQSLRSLKQNLLKRNNK